MTASKIVVIGGGPAGMMAAIQAARSCADVTLIEKNAELGKKLLLSGKGRCNLTNACERDVFLQRFSGNGQFLRDAFKTFFNKDLMRFFEERGLKLRVERQQRVFPVTDSSMSILAVLKKELAARQVKVLYKVCVQDVLVANGMVRGVRLAGGGEIKSDRVILATGGVSYAFTGSTGEGIRIAARLKHRTVPVRAGLVPLAAKPAFIRELEGLTLKNIRLVFSHGGKKLASEIGELMFTANGVSGPLVLTLSGQIADWLAVEDKTGVILEIDLKPALTEEQLHERLLREFRGSPRRTVKNTFRELLPVRLIGAFLDILRIPQDKKANQVNQRERAEMVALLKKFRLEITGTLPIEEAMITRGGVSLRDIDPRTMGSRIIKGLFFAGEMIDVDADTGGFNLQAAFSTGYLAGESSSQ
ncbi:MAG: NAD(P)/FAD-dependent oxidoreductase [Candidatus Omnitrophota bacterium]